MTRVLPIISLIWMTAGAASAETAATMRTPMIGGDQTHATRGTVKSAGATEIVVSRPKNRGDITITLSPSTHVDGNLRVGATVSVRYHDDHGRHVASAVAVDPPAPGKPASVRQVNWN